MINIASLRNKGEGTTRALKRANLIYSPLLLLLPFFFLFLYIFRNFNASFEFLINNNTMGVQEVVARLHSKKKVNTSNITLQSNTNNRELLPPSPIPSPTSTMIMNNNDITSLLQKYEKSTTTTPPESPNNSNVTHKKPKISLLNKSASEIEDLFENLIDQNNAAEEYILHLQSQVEKYSADATKVKDYEIRVEYLNTKLEQITEERDYYEEQLTQEITSQQDMKSVQMAITTYLTELEKQKLETNALKQVVKKQDELISKLEQKVECNSEESVKEQVQVQNIELDNKQELLVQLLNERKELIKALNKYNPTEASNFSMELPLSSPLSAPPKHPSPPSTSL